MKKGQEEIVGFVMIIVIVSVILLIFLGISLRNDEGSSTESVEIYHFLASANEYTSDCAIRFAPDYSRLGELFRNCLNSERCIDGRESCNALNSSLNSIVESSFLVDEESKVTGYRFRADYIAGNLTGSPAEKIIEINKGNCSYNTRGSQYILPSFPGRIVLDMEVCEA